MSWGIMLVCEGCTVYGTCPLDPDYEGKAPHLWVPRVRYVAEAKRLANRPALVGIVIIRCDYGVRPGHAIGCGHERHYRNVDDAQLALDDTERYSGWFYGVKRGGKTLDWCQWHDDGILGRAWAHKMFPDRYPAPAELQKSGQAALF